MMNNVRNLFCLAEIPAGRHDEHPKPSLNEKEQKLRGLFRVLRHFLPRRTESCIGYKLPPGSRPAHCHSHICHGQRCPAWMLIFGYQRVPVLLIFHRIALRNFVEQGFFIGTAPDGIPEQYYPAHQLLNQNEYSTICERLTYDDLYIAWESEE
jgi:hypothetical protein